jgi:hypothetical protein
MIDEVQYSLPFGVLGRIIHFVFSGMLQGIAASLGDHRANK